ncbi:MAG: sigma-70 family RNA polymerase sigma factor [Planctomycetota bacterium]
MFNEPDRSSVLSQRDLRVVRPVLRRAHRRSRRLFACELTYEDFEGETLLRALRRLSRMEHRAEPTKLKQVIENTVLEDVFLAIACDRNAAEAWQTLVAHVRPTLCQRAMRLGVVRAEAEELSDEVISSLAAAGLAGRSLLARYEGAGTLVGWLTVILSRRLADRRRREARARTMQAPLRSAAGEASRLVGPLDQASESELLLSWRRKLQSAWRGLTAKESLVLGLRFRDGLALREIAGRLGIGMPRISRILRNATDKVRQSLSRLGDSVPLSEQARHRLAEALHTQMQTPLESSSTSPEEAE